MAQTDHRTLLQRITQRAMREQGLLPEFSNAVLAELGSMQAPAGMKGEPAKDSRWIRDLTSLPWASIDHDDARDLDQVTIAEALSRDEVRIRVAVADVDALVKKGSAIDGHARHNTSSIYTIAEYFPMLPEKLSADFTSLNLDAERLALVVEMTIAANGLVLASDIYRARVRNRAQLTYNSVAAWLDGANPVPAAIAAVEGLAENLRLQEQTAQRLRRSRHLVGALNLEIIEAKPIFDGEQLRDLAVDRKNSAKELIEDFMIAANGVTARYLAARHFPSIRRVVRTPKRWDRIVVLAKANGDVLPGTPNAAALDAFLVKARAADPQHFPALSLAVVDLLGAGEYLAELPGNSPSQYFGLAVKDYAHSTAPNHRYADLVTQRLLKAAMAGSTIPYRFADLEALAAHLTEAEGAVDKVTLQVGKAAAALLLESHIGETFEALVTGASKKAVSAQLFALPVEGKVVRPSRDVDVGDRILVQLRSVDVEKGLIDLKKVRPTEQGMGMTS
jgi:VacB/RNase II family 3'-5' exoribonuclease